MPLSGSAFWACLIPVQKTNLLSNPSGERGTFGWGTALVSGGGTVGTTSQFQQFGAWAGSCAPSGAANQGGARLGTWTSGNGTDYTASVYIRGGVGSAYFLRIASNDESGVLASTAVTTGGTWHRYSVAYTENSNTNRVMTIARNGAGADAFYFDGAQVEVGSLTTFISGDEDGCIWLGAPHQSQSLRSGTYRGGGSIVALADLGLRPDQYPGVGMPPQEITAQSYALQAGAEYQRSRSGERPFTITFKPILGTTQKDFHVTRRRIIDAFKPDLLDPQQPVRFWYTGGLGTVQIDAVYHSGLDFGDLNGPMAEEGAVKFIAHDPYWYATTQEGTALASRVNLGSTNFIAKRDPYGRWGTLGANGSATDNAVTAMLFYNGTLYIGGGFGSTAGTRSGAFSFYNTQANTFGTFGGTVGGGGINAITADPNGTIIFGGAFTNISGLSNTRFIARFANGFATITGGTTNNIVNALNWTGGTLVLGGDFTGVAGTTTGGVALWRSAGYGSTTGGTFAAACDEVAIGLDRRIFAVTETTSFAAGGTTVNGIAQWFGSWGSVGGGVTGASAVGATGAAVGPNGILYVGGGFGSAGGGSAENVADWNGQQWFPMAGGLGIPTPGQVSVPYVYADQSTGDIYAAGLLNNNTGARTLPDSAARWNGYVWLPLDLDVQNNTIDVIIKAPDNTLYIGGAFNGAGSAAGVAQIVNTGIGEAYPTVKLRNTSGSTVRLYQLGNTYTGDMLYFNLTFEPGEELTLVTEPGARSFTSSFAGNVFGAILGGSNITGFRLMPGTNYISLFCDSGSVAASIYWNARSDSIDGGTTS